MKTCRLVWVNGRVQTVVMGTDRQSFALCLKTAPCCPNVWETIIIVNCIVLSAFVGACVDITNVGVRLVIQNER